jgi:hypothetical protein
VKRDTTFVTPIPAGRMPTMTNDEQQQNNKKMEIQIQNKEWNTIPDVTS